MTLFRRLIVACRQGARRGKSGHADAAHGSFGTASHHHIGIVKCDHAGRVANGMGTGGTGCHHGVVWATETIFMETCPDTRLISAEG